MSRSVSIVSLFFLGCLISSCHNDPPVIIPQVTNKQDIRENLINAHRTIAQAEETSIDEYVSRRGWDMTKLAGGARVWEYRKGSDNPVNYEDSITVHYSVEAINGTLLYDTIDETFLVGRRQLMAGLDEVLLTLHYGSRAKVILPSHQAYGIGGDGDRIPGSAILVLDVKVDAR